MSWWKKIKKQFSSEPQVPLASVRAPDRWDILKSKRDLYIQKSKEVRDQHGFIPGCDSLCFTALSVVGGYPADLSAAEEDGRWYRTPNKDCFSSGRSGSTISRDMLVGLLWATYHQSDVSRLLRLIRYGEKKFWIIGDGEVSRTFVTPQIQKLIADVLDKLGGGNLRRYRILPHIYPSGLEGYEAHLQLLQILLRLHMYGEISATMNERVHQHYHRNPKNALYSIAYQLVTYGNLNEACDILLSSSQFPIDELPSTKNRNEEYLFQRELGFDWWPNPDHSEVFSGSDLIFAVGLMEKFLER